MTTGRTPLATPVAARPFVVVMCGGTASGKTTIATALAKRTSASLIHHDRYYRDVSEPRGHDYDHPDALETALLVHHVEALKAGRAVDLPIYEFATHARSDRTERLNPPAVLIIEGILTLADPALAKLANLSVYVDAPDDIRLGRRILRDVAERGRDVRGVLDQYLTTVRPGHEAFVLPCREHAALVLDGQAPIGDSVARVLAFLP